MWRDPQTWLCIYTSSLVFETAVLPSKVKHVHWLDSFYSSFMLFFLPSAHLQQEAIKHANQATEKLLHELQPCPNKRPYETTGGLQSDRTDLPSIALNLSSFVQIIIFSPSLHLKSSKGCKSVFIQAESLKKYFYFKDYGSKGEKNTNLPFSFFVAEWFVAV